MKRFLKGMVFVGMLGVCASCTTDNPFGGMDVPGGMQGNGMGGNMGSVSDDGDKPDFDTDITAWNGETADDASLDVVGTEKDFYHEVNTFSHQVIVTYDGETASIENSNDQILCYHTGAYVTIDMQTNDVGKTEIVLKGKSENGGLKIYGTNKFKLTLEGVELHSQKGPAINSQCKKRIYVHVADGTTNRLTDVSQYADDVYYLGDAEEEDRKGCFFSEGNLIFSGHGTLVVAGKYKHGIVTDGYFWMRPGVTVVVTEAAKNAIHVKGDEDDNIGVYIGGGLIHANVSSVAGKGIKTDLHVEIAGGQLILNTSGNAVYEDDEQDTSSASGIKTDGDLSITGGTLNLKSTGTGGKGLSVDGNFNLSGGEVTVVTTGGKYTYTSDLTSSPKGVKADGDITITDGLLNIYVSGKSDGSEGLESKGTLTINGGEVYVYAYDDAINAASAFNLSGGKVYAYACNNDGVDSNGSMTINGGLLVCSGCSSPEGGIDVDNSNLFKINGGTVVAMGGTLQSSPSSSSSQRSVVYNGLSISKGKNISILDKSGKSILTIEAPRTINGGSLFFSLPDLSVNASYTISSGGTISDYSDLWNGWYQGGTWSSGTEVTTFTSGSTVTTIGTSSGMGGGGFPGGR
ncbi:MAG: carbohydrate-binding domain-containing protein [Bacteroidaceae bacterium]|nr:carbohydrate-binding domain-containing protein [Bacteroidaceae bacterium]